MTTLKTILNSNLAITTTKIIKKTKVSVEAVFEIQFPNSIENLVTPLKLGDKSK